MANIKSAKKRIKVTAKKTAANISAKSELKTSIKKFDAAIDSGDKTLAQENLKAAEKMLRKSASNGTIHKNNASRKVSKLTKKLNKLS